MGTISQAGPRRTARCIHLHHCWFLHCPTSGWMGHCWSQPSVPTPAGAPGHPPVSGPGQPSNHSPSPPALGPYPRSIQASGRYPPSFQASSRYLRSVQASVKSEDFDIQSFRRRMRPGSAYRHRAIKLIDFCRHLSVSSTQSHDQYKDLLRHLPLAISIHTPI